ncbi:hypothetical protein [Mycolicibacterium thermoresistibile]|jgi:hypothetical protein|uniref:DUF559 domain-containing protein n=2 Tax=Mycolicibacterium thermoresistibile TaxID=1797 RepID=G7CDN9_MYCT3|nr:hypothetical protein [Mycolicibacterium thermoresistibile]EHI14063.1 hypothetical protein KEK_05457 [Mycolicibacterium thermoresistibile ATCC 19527]MCV7189445.1 hypothetical protein [Mycolicibacterium thermoresistibile]GAT15113.1 putative uncharacterized protein [Mycolicibacterium thermoresistibile]SNW16338.1 cullin, a subunit of E3 ubiquitin ligase [Mycolicibacterium thermoresistibile]
MAAPFSEPFLGSEALTSGALTRHQLRTRYRAIHRDVYIANDAELDAVLRAKACWLRSRGHGVLAGFSASALHGAKYVDPRRPATVIDTNRRRTPGILTWGHTLDEDEICEIDGMRLTTPARTAVDLACRYPVGTSVAAIDALARAARLKVADIEAAAQRHPGRHGLRRAREAIALVDPGAESPRETALRLLIVRAGYPPPETQLPIHNEFGVLIGVVDMGWRDRRIAVEYEGRHHFTSRRAINRDIRRHDDMLEMGWTVLRVTAADTDGGFLRRLETAWSRPAEHSPAQHSPAQRSPAQRS